MADNETPTRQWAWRIKDARGRLVAQLDPVKMHLLRPVRALFSNHPDTIPATTLRNIAEALDAKWTRRGHLIILVYVVGLLLVYAGNLYYRAFISVSSPWDFVGIMFFSAQFVFTFGALAVTWRIARRARGPRISHVMLQHHRCPHCGYDIRALPPDAEDGVTVCPGMCLEIGAGPMKPSKKTPIADSHYGRTKDARGKVITLLDPYAMNLMRRHDVIDAEA